MVKNIYARTLYFLCEDKEAHYPIVDLIEQSLCLPIPRMEPQDFMLAMQQHKHKILLIDHNNYQQLNSAIRDLPLSNKIFETVIFNVERRLTTDELLSFGNLKALFYKTMTLPMWLLVVVKLLIAKTGCHARSLHNYCITIDMS